MDINYVVVFHLFKVRIVADIVEYQCGKQCGNAWITRALTKEELCQENWCLASQGNNKDAFVESVYWLKLESEIDVSWEVLEAFIQIFKRKWKSSPTTVKFRKLHYFF